MLVSHLSPAISSLSLSIRCAAAARSLWHVACPKIFLGPLQGKHSASVVLAFASSCVFLSSALLIKLALYSFFLRCNVLCVRASCVNSAHTCRDPFADIITDVQIHAPPWPAIVEL